MSTCIETGPAGRMDLFPFPQIRRGQDDFLADARSCLDGGVTLVAMAPTGMGKTAVSLTASLERSMPTEGCVLFLTSRQSQHAAAVRTISSMSREGSIRCVDLISREDMCLADRGRGPPCIQGGHCFFMGRDPAEAVARILERPMDVAQIMKLCKHEAVCPYRAARLAMREADVVVCDYNQVFGDAPSLMEMSGRRPEELSLIVDEAHDLPGRVMEANSARIRPKEIEEAAGCLPGFGSDLESLLAIVEGLSRTRPGTLLPSCSLDDDLRRDCGVDTSGLHREMEAALGPEDRHRHRALMAFLRRWKGKGDGWVHLASDGGLEVRLIDPSGVTGPLFRQVGATLLMSATLHPPEMYAEILGLERYACREYPSPFPPENRLVIASGGVTTLMRRRSDTMYRAIAIMIDRLTEAVPGNVAAFFPSYRLMENVGKHLIDRIGDREIVRERREYVRNEKEAIVHRMASEDGILLLATLGGSFSEGVDFRDNALKCVIVVGLPISPPSQLGECTERLLTRRFGRALARKWTTDYPAISKVLQASGRAIRSENDRAAIVLLDERYLRPSTLADFPPDFGARVSPDPLESLKTFFSDIRVDLPASGRQITAP